MTDLGAPKIERIDISSLPVSTVRVPNVAEPGLHASGTTGVPKDIVTSHANIRSNLEFSAQVSKLGSEAVLQQAALSFDLILDSPAEISILSHKHEVQYHSQQYYPVRGQPDPCWPLGLTEKDFERLGDKVDMILHTGAQRAFCESYQILRGANVNSTKELVQLAGRRNVPLHFLSSGGVLGLNKASQNNEDNEAHSACEVCPPIDGPNSYVATKCASERFLENAAEELGMPVFIGRPIAATQPTLNSTAVLNELVQRAQAAKTRRILGGWRGTFDLIRIEDMAGQIMRAVAGPSEMKDSIKYARYLRPIGV